MTRCSVGGLLLALAATATGQPKKPAFEMLPGEVVQHKGHDGRVLAVAINPEGTVVYSAGTDKTLRAWPKLKSVGKEQIWKGFGSPFAAAVKSIQFIPPVKGKTKSQTAAVIVGGDLWLADLTTGRGLNRLSEGITATAVSTDGKWLAGGFHLNELHIWNAQTGVRAGKIALPSRPNAVGFSPDGTGVVVDTDQEMLRGYEFKNGTATQKYKGVTRPVVSIVFRPDGKSFLSAGHADDVWLWDVATGNVIAKFPGHERGVSQIAVTPDGNRFVAASASGSLKVWDVAGERLLADLKGPAGPVTSVAMAPNGGWVAAGGSDETVWLFGLPK